MKARRLYPDSTMPMTASERALYERVLEERRSHWSKKGREYDDAQRLGVAAAEREVKRSRAKGGEPEQPDLFAAPPRRREG